MKINKEYPATHSMSTAWYCVGEEGNVALHAYLPVNDQKTSALFRGTKR